MIFGHWQRLLAGFAPFVVQQPQRSCIARQVASGGLAMASAVVRVNEWSRDAENPELIAGWRSGRSRFFGRIGHKCRHTLDAAEGSDPVLLHSESGPAR